jgi:hypothetical protein
MHQVNYDYLQLYNTAFMSNAAATKEHHPDMADRHVSSG